MICPSCNTGNQLTWKKYLSSPLGKHNCEHCQTVFKIKHNYKYYLSIAVLAILLFALVASVHIYLKSSIVQVVSAYLLLVLVVLMPLDKKMDNAWRESAPQK